MPSPRSRSGKSGPRIVRRLTSGRFARAKAEGFAGMVIVLVLFGLLSRVAFAQPNHPEQAESKASTETAPTDPAERAAREQLVRSGILLIVGIAMLGGLLVIVTLLWGGSARRQARTPLPISPPRDELWYLRKKAATAGDADDADSVRQADNDRAAGDEDDDDDSKQANSS